MHEIFINNEELSKKESQIKDIAYRINSIKDNLHDISNTLDFEVKNTENISYEINILYKDLERIESQLYENGDFIRDTCKYYNEIERKIKLVFYALDNGLVIDKSTGLPLADKKEESFFTRIFNDVKSGLKHLRDFFTGSNEEVNNKTKPNYYSSNYFVTANDYINYDIFKYYAYNPRLYMESKEYWRTGNKIDESKNIDNDYNGDDRWYYNGSNSLPLALGIDDALLNGFIRKSTNWVKKQLGMDNIYEDKGLQYLVNHDSVFGTYYDAGQALGVLPLLGGGGQGYSATPSMVTTTGEVIPSVMATDIGIPGIMFSYDGKISKNKKKTKKPNYGDYVKSGNGQPPQNFSPDGADRNGAFREAKRASNIPVSEEPVKVTNAVDKRGNEIPGKDYHFKGGKVIREHYGHQFSDDVIQNRGTHFNDIFGNHYDY